MWVKHLYRVEIWSTDLVILEQNWDSERCLKKVLNIQGDFLKIIYKFYKKKYFLQFVQFHLSTIFIINNIYNSVFSWWFIQISSSIKYLIFFLFGPSKYTYIDNYIVKILIVLKELSRGNEVFFLLNENANFILFIFLKVAKFEIK